MLEFIQNAEDANATKMKMALIEENSGHKLIIYNNGDPFSKDDVDALCSIGRLRKNPETYLGYLGVGFKSAFLVSDSICIYSWPWSFTLDKSS